MLMFGLTQKPHIRLWEHTYVQKDKFGLGGGGGGGDVLKIFFFFLYV